MTSYPRLAARLYNVALMIEPGKAEVIEAVFRAYAEGRGPEQAKPEAKKTAQPPTPMERTDNGYQLTAGGVAVLPVHGTLVQRAGGIDALSGLTGYNMVSARLQAALADPKVRGIVMEFDSPGGEVAGVFELAGQIAAATKPVYAHANEMMFSAAYALGVGAEKLFMAQTSMVGSVGVIMMHVDQSGADAKRGMVYTPIYAGAKKVDYSSHAPLSDRARESAQASVDQLYELFVSHVADARAISADVVKGTEAGRLTPGAALDNGMADGQATLTEVIQRMQDSLSSSFQGYSRPSRALTERSNTMSTNEKTPGQAAATTEQQQAAIAEAEARGRAAAATENQQAVATARTVERARVKAITEHAEAQGREKMAAHLANNTDMGVEAAIALLKVSAKEQATTAAANQFAEHMAKQGNARVAADGGGEASKVTAPVASKVYEFRQKCVADARKSAA